MQSMLGEIDIFNSIENIDTIFKSFTYINTQYTQYQKHRQQLTIMKIHAEKFIEMHDQILSSGSPEIIEAYLKEIDFEFPDKSNRDTSVWYKAVYNDVRYIFIPHNAVPSSNISTSGLEFNKLCLAFLGVNPNEINELKDFLKDFYGNEIYQPRSKSPEPLFYDILTKSDFNYEWFKSIGNFIKFYAPEKEIKLHRLDTEKSTTKDTTTRVVEHRKHVSYNPFIEGSSKLDKNIELELGKIIQKNY